jgi:hypothetical protein
LEAVPRGQFGEPLLESVAPAEGLGEAELSEPDPERFGDNQPFRGLVEVDGREIRNRGNWAGVVYSKRVGQVHGNEQGRSD